MIIIIIVYFSGTLISTNTNNIMHFWTHNDVTGNTSRILEVRIKNKNIDLSS